MADEWDQYVTSTATAPADEWEQYAKPDEWDAFSKPAEPGETPETALNEMHPDLGWGFGSDRFVPQNFTGANPNEAVRELEARGFEAKAIGGLLTPHTFALRKPGGKWYQLEHSGPTLNPLEMVRDTMDVAGGIFTGVTGTAGAAAGALAGFPTTGPGGVATTAVGFGLGAAAGEGVLQGLGDLVRQAPAEMGEKLTAVGIEGAAGVTGDLIARGLGYGGRQLLQKLRGQKIAGGAMEVPGRVPGGPAGVMPEPPIEPSVKPVTALHPEPQPTLQGAQAEALEAAARGETATSEVFTPEAVEEILHRASTEHGNVISVKALLKDNPEPQWVTGAVEYLPELKTSKGRNVPEETFFLRDVDPQTGARLGDFTRSKAGTPTEELLQEAYKAGMKPGQPFMEGSREALLAFLETKQPYWTRGTAEDLTKRGFKGPIGKQIADYGLFRVTEFPESMAARGSSRGAAGGYTHLRKDQVVEVIVGGKHYVFRDGQAQLAQPKIHSTPPEAIILQNAQREAQSKALQRMADAGSAAERPPDTAVGHPSVSKPPESAPSLPGGISEEDAGRLIVTPEVGDLPGPNAADLKQRAWLAEKTRIRAEQQAAADAELKRRLLRDKEEKAAAVRAEADRQAKLQAERIADAAWRAEHIPNAPAPGRPMAPVEQTPFHQGEYTLGRRLAAMGGGMAALGAKPRQIAGGALGVVGGGLGGGPVARMGRFLGRKAIRENVGEGPGLAPALASVGIGAGGIASGNVYGMVPGVPLLAGGLLELAGLGIQGAGRLLMRDNGRLLQAIANTAGGRVAALARAALLQQERGHDAYRAAVWLLVQQPDFRSWVQSQQPEEAQR